MKPTKKPKYAVNLEIQDSKPARWEWLPLAEIEFADENPREHDLGAIHESINRFGFVGSVTIDERTGKLVAGHGRIKALRQKQAAGEPMPAGLEDRGDDWYVPVDRGTAFRDNDEATGYLLADNKVAERSGWTDASLVPLLERLNAGNQGLGGTGFDADDLDRLLIELYGNRDDQLQETSHSQNGQQSLKIIIPIEPQDQENLALKEALGNFCNQYSLRFKIIKT